MSTPRKRRKAVVCDALDWRAFACDDGHIHIKLQKPGAEPFEFIVGPEDGYDLSAEICRAYDQINGI